MTTEEAKYFKDYIDQQLQALSAGWGAENRKFVTAKEFAEQYMRTITGQEFLPQETFRLFLESFPSMLFVDEKDPVAMQFVNQLLAYKDQHTKDYKLTWKTINTHYDRQVKNDARIEKLITDYIASNDARVDEDETSINGINAYCNNNATKLNEHEERISTLETCCDKVKTTLTSLRNSVDTNTANVGQCISEIDSLEGRTSKLENDMLTHTHSINQVTKLSVELKAINQRIENLMYDEDADEDGVVKHNTHGSDIGGDGEEGTEGSTKTEVVKPDTRWDNPFGDTIHLVEIRNNIPLNPKNGYYMFVQGYEYNLNPNNNKARYYPLYFENSRVKVGYIGKKHTEDEIKTYEPSTYLTTKDTIKVTQHTIRCCDANHILERNEEVVYNNESGRYPVTDQEFVSGLVFDEETHNYTNTYYVVSERKRQEVTIGGEGKEKTTNVATYPYNGKNVPFSQFVLYKYKNGEGWSAIPNYNRNAVFINKSNKVRYKILTIGGEQYPYKNADRQDNLNKSPISAFIPLDYRHATPIFFRNIGKGRHYRHRYVRALGRKHYDKYGKYDVVNYCCTRMGTTLAKHTYEGQFEYRHGEIRLARDWKVRRRCGYPTPWNVAGVFKVNVSKLNRNSPCYRYMKK